MFEQVMKMIILNGSCCNLPFFFLLYFEMQIRNSEEIHL